MAGTACAALWCAECYEEWAESERLREAAEAARHAAKVLAEDDPECEAAVAALEEVWNLAKG